MRMRVIKPDFWKSPKLANLASDWDAKLVLAGVWSYVEDNGVGLDNPALISAELFPFEDQTIAVPRTAGALDRLFFAGHIDRYKVEVDGTYLNLVGVCDWRNWQRPDKPSATRYPPSDRVKSKKPARHSRVPRDEPARHSPPGVRSSEIGVRSSELEIRTSEHFAKQSASMSGTAHARDAEEATRAASTAALRELYPDQFNGDGVHDPKLAKEPSTVTGHLATLRKHFNGTPLTVREVTSFYCGNAPTKGQLGSTRERLNIAVDRGLAAVTTDGLGSRYRPLPTDGWQP